MTVRETLTDQYYGVPLWGWIAFIVILLLIIIAIAASSKKAEKKADDQAMREINSAEAGIKIPEVHPPMTPSPVQEFQRDRPLPPPAPSETSLNGRY